MFRRYLDKYLAKVPKITSIFQAYSTQRYVGVHTDDVKLEDLTPAPLPGQDERHKWNASNIPSGPVGLLLQNVHHLDATADFNNHTI